jgi:hypothetical protein
MEEMGVQSRRQNRGLRGGLCRRLFRVRLMEWILHDRLNMFTLKYREINHWFLTYVKTGILQMRPSCHWKLITLITKRFLSVYCFCWFSNFSESTNKRWDIDPIVRYTSLLTLPDFGQWLYNWDVIC